jgi:TonB family protein
MTEPRPLPAPEPLPYGAIAWLEGRRLNARRLARLQVIVGLVLLAPLLALRLTPLGHQVREIPVMRFGFEGAPRIVALVPEAADPDARDAPMDVGRIVSRGGVAGSKTEHAAVREDTRHGHVVLPAPGAGGEGGHELVTRALASRGTVPVMQSSDVVIDVLVRPDYPLDARARGAAGHVAVLAEVDTAGAIVAAEVMTSTGDAELDELSRRAVLHCKLRPFRPDGPEGHPIGLFVVFRYLFRLD